MLTVERAGPLLTVQDLGRPGYAHLGVPHAGAADRDALVRANRLVSNPDDAAGLEVTLLGCWLHSDSDVLVALAGPDGDRVLGVGEGETLRVPTPRRGARGYVAVAGGLLVAPVLGSRSHDTLSGLGPPPLRDGARLAVGSLRGEGRVPDPAPPLADVLALLPGPRHDWVDLGSLPATYVVSPDSNRVGVRLIGPPLPHLGRGELPSEGLVRGAVQVPPDGQPVIMLADHPTTGGYPVIGVVPEALMSTVAQLRPGTTITLAVASPYS